MNHDKAFAIYAVALVAGVFTVIATAVNLGIASAPDLSFMMKELVLAVGLRAAYKSLDGSNPLVDFLEFYGWKTPEAEAGVPAHAVPSAA